MSAMSIGVKTPEAAEEEAAKAQFLEYIRVLDEGERDALTALRSIITTAGVKDQDKIAAAGVALHHVQVTRERLASYALAQRQGAQTAR